VNTRLGRLGRRVLQGFFVLWLASSLAFFALQLVPGDPARALLAASGATPEEVAARRTELGLDDPVLVQYLRYLGSLARGDLGQSWLHGRSVRRMIGEQLPSTLTLAVSATGVGVALGVVLGTLGAIRHTTWLDRATTALAVLGISAPTAWTGLVAILLFSLRLRWLPATGSGGVRHLILPTLVLGFALAGSIARLMRARLADVIQKPFVMAARARGLPRWRILFLHVMRPALSTVPTIVALQVGFLLGGAVITESVFTRQGLGQLAVEAIRWRDLPVVRGVVVFSAAAYVAVNLAADLAELWLDPRQRGSAV